MTTSPTFADHISALTDRLDRIERVLGLGVSQDSGASLQSSEALLNAERDLNVLEATLGHHVEGPVDLVGFLTKLGKVQAHLLQDSIRVLGHGSPHSSVTGTPEGSDSAGPPSGDPAESCGPAMGRPALEERWVTVTESGDRWAGRSREEAEANARDYPAGSTWPGTGERIDGITHIERETRFVTPWRVEEES